MAREFASSVDAEGYKYLAVDYTKGELSEAFRRAGLIPHGLEIVGIDFGESVVTIEYERPAEGKKEAP